MKTIAHALLAALLAAAPLAAQTPDGEVDMQKARQLFQRQQAGETLNSEERAYLERAKAMRAAQEQKGRPASPAAAGEIDWRKAQELHARSQRGEKLAPEDQAYLERAMAARGQQPAGRNGGGAQRKAPEHMTPLSDMTAQDRYEGEDGGLYGGGRNAPPPELQKAAEAQLARMKPLDADGKPAAAGRVVLISISMSNATAEFSMFKKLADESPAKADRVTVVDCAQGGQTMARWAPPDAPAWQEAKARLARASVTPQQVQAAWIKLANAGPSGSLQEHGHKLESDTVAVLHNARSFFPNLRIAYLDSRIWAGNASTPLNPEPYAYEGAFVVRWLIHRQLKGDPELADAKSPLLLWGPYLWAEGEKGRKLDDLVWKPTDFAGDGTHPNDAGREKVARLLLKFFSSDPLAKSWFTK